MLSIEETTRRESHVRDTVNKEGCTVIGRLGSNAYLRRAKLSFSQNRRMERPWTESTWKLKVFEQLVVNEAQCPVYGQRRAAIQKIRNRRVHIKSNLQFGGLIRVGYNSCRNDFGLWNENLSRFDCAGDVNDRETDARAMASREKVILIPLTRSHLSLPNRPTRDGRFRFLVSQHVPCLSRPVCSFLEGQALLRRPASHRHWWRKETHSPDLEPHSDRKLPGE
jgi:hypothetical protein